MNKRGKIILSAIIISTIIFSILYLYFVVADSGNDNWVIESIISPDINLEKTGEAMPSTNNNQQSSTDDSTTSSGSKTTIIREKEIIRLIPGDKESEDKTQEDKETIKLGKPGITGEVTGTGLFSGSSLIFIIIILCITFVIFLIVTSKTILKVKSFSRKT
jgi:hypothetical protein